MSERESKATENYQAFNLLRSRFGGAKKPQPKPQRREKRRRRDPRFEAPPLKPLVEEGDLSTVPEITQQAQANSPVSTNYNQSEVTCENLVAQHAIYKQSMHCFSSTKWMEVLTLHHPTKCCNQIKVEVRTSEAFYYMLALILRGNVYYYSTRSPNIIGDGKTLGIYS